MTLRATFALLLLTAGCVKHPAGGSDASAPDGAIVLRRSEMRSGTLLDALTARLPTMMVTRRAGECPLISFRGVRTLNAPENPSVYVDGTLMTNTCSLTDLSSSDVEVVEIYTSGASGRAGIQRNTAGVILIFRARR